MEFEWDPTKAKRNFRKHGISFVEAASVFSDPLATFYEDPDHSSHERRYLMIGTSAQGPLLNIAFIDQGERIRIVSARRATKREKKFYEEENR